MAKRSKSIVEISRSDIRWRQGKESFRETKKQRRLFEFDIPTASSLNVRQRSFEDVKTSEKELIVIEDEDDTLTESERNHVLLGEDVQAAENMNDEDERISSLKEPVAKEKAGPTISFSPSSVHEKILCPICTTDLTKWEDYQREAHAEKCLEKFDDKKVNKRVIKRPPLSQIKILTFANKHKIVVDGFNFERDVNISQYFLSHFHADHYMGLRKSWDHGTIYGSEITINLMLQKFNISRDLARVLPMHIETWFEPTISVIPLDANHCPGATVFLFQEWNASRTKIIKQILHTGDFRSNESLIARLNDICLTPIDQVYLDTTYLIPGFHFPFQSNVLNVSAEFCQQIVEQGKGKLFNDSQKSIFNFKLIRNSKFQRNKFLYKCLFLIGTYTIGKEKLAIAIAQGLKTKIYVPIKTPRFKIISQYLKYFPPGLITHNLEESCVHLVPLSTLRSKESIDDYFRRFSDVYEDLVGFIPTGWTFTTRYASNLKFADTAERVAYCKDILEDAAADLMNVEFIHKQYKRHAKYQVFKVPYSEHSSFKDLVRFGTAVDYKEMLATVNLNEMNKIRDMQEWFKAWQCIRSGKIPNAIK